MSLPLEGNSSSLSSQQVVTSIVNSSGSGGASGGAVLLEKKIITQTSAEGGASRSYVISCESRNHPVSNIYAGNGEEIGSSNIYSLLIYSKLYYSFTRLLKYFGTDMKVLVISHNILHYLVSPHIY